MKKNTWKYIVGGLVVVAVIIIAALSRGDNEGGSERFAMSAISPEQEKSVCAKGDYDSVLSAMKDNGFDIEQDSSGLVSSVLGYRTEEQEVSDTMKFWSFWEGSKDKELDFAQAGPGQIDPESGDIFVFDYGDGSNKPDVSFSDICK